MPNKRKMESKNNLDDLLSVFSSNGLLSKALYSTVFSKYLDYEVRNKFFWLFGNEHCTRITDGVQEQCKERYVADSELIDNIGSLKTELEKRFSSTDGHNNWQTAYYIICDLQGIYEHFRSVIELEKTTEVLLQANYYTKTDDIVDRYVNRMYHGYLDFISLFDAICLKNSIDIDSRDLFKGCCCADYREERDVAKTIKYIGGQNLYERFVLEVMDEDRFLEKCSQVERLDQANLFTYVKRTTSNFSKEETKYFKKDLEGYFRAGLQNEFYHQLRTHYGLDREVLDKEWVMLEEDFDNFLYKNEINPKNKWLNAVLSRFYNYKTIVEILHENYKEDKSVENIAVHKEKRFKDYLVDKPHIKDKAIELLVQPKIKPKKIATIFLALYKLRYLALSTGERNKLIKAFYDEYKTEIAYTSTLDALQNGINEHIKSKLDATHSTQGSIKDEDIEVYMSQLE